MKKKSFVNKPTTMLLTILALQLFFVAFVWAGGSAPTGDTCPERFPAQGGLDASFYDPGWYGSCWSCPDGYNRSVAPVTAKNGCYKSIQGWSKATDVGKYGCKNKYKDRIRAFFDPIDGGTCWECPKGYNRTWTPVTAEDACATGWFGKKSPATRLGSEGCDHPSAFKDPIDGGTCWTCPSGYNRTVFSVKSDKACERTEIDSPGTMRGHPGAPPAADCPPAPKVPDASSVTFYVATDPHIGEEDFTSNDIIKNVAEMNNLFDNGLVWPPMFSTAGQIMKPPVAVVTTGDLTHYGHEWQLNFFRWLYENEVRTKREYMDAIKAPVYIGLGNHDLDGDCYANNCAQRMFNYVKTRNTRGCMGVTNFHDGSHNYSWDWNKIHLVQLHKWAGDTTYGKYAKHASGLDWLKKDLDSMESTHPGRAIILFQHFGFGSFSQQWWSNKDRNNFYEAIQGHNVIGIFVGHSHTPSKQVFNDIDVFQGGTGGENGTGQFFVVHVSDTNLDVSLLKWTGGVSGLQFDPTIQFAKTITTN